MPKRPASARMKAAIASAKPIAAPLSVSGLNAPLANALTKAAAKAGPAGARGARRGRSGASRRRRCSRARRSRSATRTATCARARPARWPTSTATGSGSSATSSRATAGARCCCRTPTSTGSSTTRCSSGRSRSTYKLAASGHDLGTISNDGFSAVAGRTGVLPHTVPISVIADDEDAKARNVVNTKAADEAAVDLPSGGSWTSAIAPLAVAQAASSVLGSVPGRADRRDVRADRGRRDQEAAALLQPLRLRPAAARATTAARPTPCSAAPPTTSAARSATIDAYTGKPPNVTGVNVLLKVHRGADQAFIRASRCRRACGAGQKVRSRSRCRSCAAPGSPAPTRCAIPRDAPPGRQTLRLVGQDADQGADAFTTIILGEDETSDERGRRPRPVVARRARRRRSARPSASTASASASAAPAARPSATTTTASPARPRRSSASRAR